MREANVTNLKVGDKVVGKNKYKLYLLEQGVKIDTIGYGIVKMIDPEDDTAYVNFISYKGHHLIGIWLGIPKNKSEILFYEPY